MYDKKQKTDQTANNQIIKENETKPGIQTIRLDRLELGIPELRERVKQLLKLRRKKLNLLVVVKFLGNY